MSHNATRTKDATTIWVACKGIELWEKVGPRGLREVLARSFECHHLVIAFAAKCHDPRCCGQRLRNQRAETNTTHMTLLHRFLVSARVEDVSPLRWNRKLLSNGE